MKKNTTLQVNVSSNLLYVFVSINPGAYVPSDNKRKRPHKHSYKRLKVLTLSSFDTHNYKELTDALSTRIRISRSTQSIKIGIDINQ